MKQTMSANYPQELRRLARDAEVEVIEKPDGHFLIVGGLVTVHYWPHSRRLTAYVEGAPQGKPNCTPKMVVKLATQGMS